jgi:hypothetical protein
VRWRVLVRWCHAHVPEPHDLRVRVAGRLARPRRSPRSGGLMAYPVYVWSRSRSSPSAFTLDNAHPPHASSAVVEHRGEGERAVHDEYGGPTSRRATRRWQRSGLPRSAVPARRPSGSSRTARPRGRALALSCQTQTVSLFVVPVRHTETGAPHWTVQHRDSSARGALHLEERGGGRPGNPDVVPLTVAAPFPDRHRTRFVYDPPRTARTCSCRLSVQPHSSPGAKVNDVAPIALGFP